MNEFFLFFFFIVLVPVGAIIGFLIAAHARIRTLHIEFSLLEKTMSGKMDTLRRELHKALEELRQQAPAAAAPPPKEERAPSAQPQETMEPAARAVQPQKAAEPVPTTTQSRVKAEEAPPTGPMPPPPVVPPAPVVPPPPVIPPQVTIPPTPPVQPAPAVAAVQPATAVAAVQPATAVAAAREGQARQTVPPPPGRSRTEWEALIGGQWLNRIGALALVIGLGFFLKYAFDNHWISETMRVLIGVGVGVALLLLGRRFHRKELVIFAQGVIGAGLCSLYLSIYAAFNFYHLVSQSTAVGLMAVVTGLGFWIAVRTNALVISLLVWAGGFLTPFLLSTGRVNAPGLFTYLLLLSAGILSVVILRRHWVVLEGLTFAALWLMMIAWYTRYYSPREFGLTVIFLTAFWALFYILDVLRLQGGVLSAAALRQTIAAVNAGVYYLLLYLTVNPRHHAWMGALTLLLGLVYFLTILWARHRRPDDDFIAARYILTAMILLVLATSIQLHGYRIAVGWALEALVLMACGRRWRRAYVWGGALCLLLLALFQTVSQTDAFTRLAPTAHLVLNWRMAAWAALALAAALGAWVFRRIRPDESSLAIARVLDYSWTVMVFLWLWLETQHGFSRAILRATEADTISWLNYAAPLAAALVWMVFGLVLLNAGWRYNRPEWRRMGGGGGVLACLIAMLMAPQYIPIDRFVPVLNIRAVVLSLLAVGLVGILRWGRRCFSEWTDAHVAVEFLRLLLVVLLGELLTTEIHDGFHRLVVQSRDTSLWFAGSMSLTAAWALFSIALAGYGRRFLVAVYRHAGAVTALLALGGGLLWGMNFVPLATFTPLLNIRFAVFVLLLVVLLRHIAWQASDPGKAFPPWSIAVFRAAVASLFVLTVHYEISTWFAGRQAILSVSDYPLRMILQFRESLSLGAAWALCSVPLLTLGVRRRIPPFQIVGLLSLGAGVLTVGWAGFRFLPLDDFRPLLNIRFVAMSAAAAALAWAYFLARGRFGRERWSATAAVVIQIALVLLALEIVSLEPWYHFSAALARQPELPAAERLALLNMRQMALSIAWLVYSILLLVVGLWRRIQRVRIAAIVLFAVAILKIFLYDLSYLETLYRIFSFIGLGVILLIVSFLYQRFKSVLFDPGGG